MCDACLLGSLCDSDVIDTRKHWPIRSGLVFLLFCVFYGFYVSGNSCRAVLCLQQVLWTPDLSPLGPDYPIIVRTKKLTLLNQVLDMLPTITVQKRLLFKAPSLKASKLYHRRPRVSTMSIKFQLQYFEFLFGEVKQLI